ncbi:hypothetical protein [Afipia sp. GAS231]|uniref:hypothetical protein n=1 Tax=Afipia sp. GAS231 TaxID=1882747 RepID=UPI00087CE9EA|nr:hypothetical protein [Afipia sp. GAS231]SDM88451.1 hypothetical protein SAMN05444050_0095 [Afipia sp. GAS231]
MARAGICLAALGAMFASAVSAEGPSSTAFKVISPIFGQLVMFSMPQAFVVVGESTNGPSYIREAVLKGETASSWTQMITVTGAKGLVANPKVTPEAFAASIAGGFKSACPDTFVAKGVGSAKFGDQDGYVALASCGSVVSAPDKHSETALVVAVKGSADYYTLQWAERGPASGKPVIDEAKWLERLHQLQPIRLCPIVSGEAAPYPSCVNRS